MNKTKRGPIALVAILMLAGCGSAERVDLAEYDFVGAYADEVYGPRYGGDTAVHAFGPGWSFPEIEGIWSVGRSSEITLHALGRDAQLTFFFSTSAPLAQTAQVVRILVNDKEVGRSLMKDQWRVATCTVDIPNDVLKQGVNQVLLEPSHILPDVEHDVPDDRPLGFFLRGFHLSARLDPGELKKWKELTHRTELPEATTTMTLPASDAPPPDPSKLPDVLVILMDSARADHLSCYGYERETTPNIDALAAEGVHLTQVVADASYTRCSVTSLFTGRSWVQHKVIKRKHSLTPDAVTWAEVMKAAGYQTLGVSDNPNVSKNSGLDQGFEEWVEIWNHRSEGPETAVRRFEEKVDRLNPRPAFAYVHLLPPHTPYHPGKYDLWKPEGYAGNIVGGQGNVDQFDRGERRAEGPDFERLISMYDGGMRRSDAMVGEILRIWNALERDRPTLTVILSDHGEAFGEHGRFGHNHTVFDEMTVVPVILHPASVFEGLRSSAGVLRALADVVPIVLHYAKVAPPPGTSWPRHYLGVLEKPQLARESVVIRSAGVTHGLRTPTSLTFFKLWNEQAHYDLEKDPHAAHNLRLTKADDYLRAVTEIRGLLEGTDSAWTAAEGELSEQDIENLKALGYL